MLIRTKPAWHLPEREVTDPAFVLSRRRFVATMMMAAGATVGGACSPEQLPKDAHGHTVASTVPGPLPPYPFPRNPRFTADRPLTKPLVAATFNNFYEFTDEKDGVWKQAENFRTESWTLEVSGLVSRPEVFTVGQLLRFMPVEERIYRHRCVEAWAMTVPWTGFPLSALLGRAEPKATARFVRFVSASVPAEAPGMRDHPWLGWPYREGLRIDEAMNDLTMMVTGIYGHALPKQHGAPIRVVIPWKYGFKSAKSVVKIDLVADEPRTFWPEILPAEYSFEANVDPSRPHPRWSQQSERLIGSFFNVRQTLPYNGYGEFVKQLYV